MGLCVTYRKRDHVIASRSIVSLGVRSGQASVSGKGQDIKAAGVVLFTPGNHRGCHPTITSVIVFFSDC